MEGRDILSDLAQAAEESPRRGFRLVDRHLRVVDLTYDELYSTSRQAALGWLEAGVQPGDRVLLPLPTGKAFLTGFFGSMIAGAVPCAAIAPQEAAATASWDRRMRDIAQMLGARAILVEEPHASTLEPVLPAGCRVLTPTQLLAGSGTPPAISRSPDDIAFIQLTSGTTALPKAVQLSHGALASNVRQIALRSGTDRHSVGVNWLPLHHDMGLVGSVMTSIHARIDLVLMRPFQFLHRPDSWLQAIDRFGGTHSPAPTFAYRYVLQRLDRTPLPRLSLATWQTAYVGAEPVQADILYAFERQMKQFGFSEHALFPCYGMAEASLAVTCKPLGEPFKTLLISRRALAHENRAGAPTADSDALTVVSCGTPMEHTIVAVVDHHGHELPDGCVGEIRVSGPSVFSGYFGESLAPVGPSTVHTGDLGFLDKGELYVVGRTKDVIILGGANHHPAEVEWVAGQVEGVRAGKAAALGIFDPESGTERLCVMVEVDPKRRVEPPELVAALRQHVRDATGLVVSDVDLAPPGTIPVTTSGKIQRSRVKELFLERRAATSPGG